MNDSIYPVGSIRFSYDDVSEDDLRKIHMWKKLSDTEWITTTTTNEIPRSHRVISPPHTHNINLKNSGVISFNMPSTVICPLLSETQRLYRFISNFKPIFFNYYPDKSFDYFFEPNKFEKDNYGLDAFVVKFNFNINELQMKDDKFVCDKTVFLNTISSCFGIDFVDSVMKDYDIVVFLLRNGFRRKDKYSVKSLHDKIKGNWNVGDDIVSSQSISIPHVFPTNPDNFSVSLEWKTSLD